MNLTVGELLDYIEKNNISRESKIFCEKIEDSYFSNNNPSPWKTIKKEGWHYFQSLMVNKDIDSGKFGDKKINKISDEELEKSKEEYITAISVTQYKEDDNLYIRAHY